ncbi:unnamed protein product [Acanthocheilonema viteae]|uniref:DNA-directed primase/polymerase protein n=1 Tax=Acanthocheilonema viteae TaxID=6277 RepID=A0A498S7U9_ACAVI|nr:unnamed protein product [Acanthocheilonema viteae]
MSTRVYRLWQPGNPKIRVFLPDFWMKVVDPHPVRLPKHVVKFEVDKRMTRHDIREYLEKIYNLPVREVRTLVKSGQVTYDFPLDKEKRKALWKEDDKKYAYVFMKKGFEFQLPNLFEKCEEQEMWEKMKQKIPDVTNAEMIDMKRLDLIDDKEIWFYGSHDKCERATITDQTVSNKAQKQKSKQSLFEDSLGCFVIYKRQNDAVLKCEQEGPMARVFAFEYSIHHPGQRRYLVSTVERFWQWYKRQCDVSFYELIPQNRPAHLYFDLEFYRETNPNVKEEKLIKDFNDCVSEVFTEMFGIDLSPEKEMLVLDASTTTKFSEHIIVHLINGQLFPSNTSMKSFMQQLKEKMLSSGRCLVWNADATKLVTFFDAAVYSANRNFRLYLSSKLGKNNPLVLAQRCNFYAHKKHRSRKQIFLDSLIVPIKYNTPEIFHLSITNGEFPTIQSREPKILTLPTRVPVSNENVDCMIGHGATSPFPVLDQHIIAINRSQIAVIVSILAESIGVTEYIGLWI